MNRFAHVLSALLSITSVAGTAAASDEAKSPRVPDDVQVGGDAEPNGSSLLSDDAFSLRRRSTLELWRDRDRYRESVVAAARSNDSETAERARWILGRWQRGILSETPADLAQKLATLSPDQAIERLLEAGEFAAAATAVRESYDTLDFKNISTRVSINLDQRFPVYARAAVRSNRTAEFSNFLDAACSTSAMAVSRRDWMKLFTPDSAPEMETRLPKSAETWAGDLAQRTQILLELLAGKVDAATESASVADHPILETAIDADSSGDAVFAKLSEQQQQPLARSVRMITGQWPAMAAAAAESARAWEHAALPVANAAKEQDQQDDANSPSPVTPASAVQLARYRGAAIRQWADALIAADRSGDQELRSAAVTGLVDNVRALKNIEKSSKSTSDSTVDVHSLAWRTLVTHGEIDAGLEIAGQDDPAAAAEIASNASRSTEAFEILGYPADQIDTHLEDWIDEAIAAQREVFEAINDPFAETKISPIPKSGIAIETGKLLTLIRLLDGVNRDDAAWRIADRLSLPDLQVQIPHSPTSYLVRDGVLSTLLWSTHSDWMFQLGMRDWETEPTRRSLYTIRQVTVTDNFQVLEILQRFVRMRRPQLTAIEAFRIACEIARADDIDRRQHADLILELAQSLRDGSLFHRMADDENLQRLTRPTSEVWSDLLVAHGRADLAEPFLQQRSSAGDLQAALALAKQYRWSGPAAVSNDLNELIWQAVAMSPIYRNPGLHDDMNTAVTAMGEQWRAARDDGDRDTAAELLLQLRAMACTPSSDMRQQIADVLADLGQWQIADEIYRSLLVMTALTSEDTLSMFEFARKYQRFAHKATASKIETTESAVDKEFDSTLSSQGWELRHDAVEWFDMAFIRTLDQVSLRPQLYLVFPRLFAREQLELAISQASTGRSAPTQPSIAQLLDRLRRLDTLDITTAESVFPKLSKMGMKDLVVSEIKRMIGAANLHLRTFPSDAVIANNVAWAAAVNDVELDEGLRLARRAVRFEADSAIYRDTLAEILARKGNFAEAVQIERGCVIDDPGQWHLHEQVRRFEKKLTKSR